MIKQLQQSIGNNFEKFVDSEYLGIFLLFMLVALCIFSSTLKWDGDAYLDLGKERKRDENKLCTVRIK